MDTWTWCYQTSVNRLDAADAHSSTLCWLDLSQQGFVGLQDPPTDSQGPSAPPPQNRWGNSAALTPPVAPFINHRPAQVSSSSPQLYFTLNIRLYRHWLFMFSDFSWIRYFWLKTKRMIDRIPSPLSKSSTGKLPLFDHFLLFKILTTSVKQEAQSQACHDLSRWDDGHFFLFPFLGVNK